MEFIEKNSIKTLSNPGCKSLQLLYPQNSTSKRVTITEVHVEANGTQPRHKHENSEQIWYALEGQAKLLLAEGLTKDFSKGDVVRFEEGDIHGLLNDSTEEFIYLSVTTPPINFSYAYKESK